MAGGETLTAGEEEEVWRGATRFEKGSVGLLVSKVTHD